MAMKRQFPWTKEFNVVSSDSSSSSSDSDMETVTRDNWNFSLSANNMKFDMPVSTLLSPEALLMRRAETYQEYMKSLPLPTLRGSVIPFSSWTGLGNSLKKLYEQPLHYLTNILLKQWDQARIGCEDENTPLDYIIHPIKAEATVWLMEEVHRRASSHHVVAKHWLSDPMHTAFIDSMIPQC